MGPTFDSAFLTAEVRTGRPPESSDRLLSASFLRVALRIVQGHPASSRLG